MKEPLSRLGKRIITELDEIERSLERALDGWTRFQQSSDDLYLDSTALNLHSVYNGIEKLFDMIATTVDTNRPQGSEWHQALLQQMAIEIPGIRPAVISEISCDGLDKYRKFRHVVRHIYAFHFDAAQLQQLVEAAPYLLAEVKAELIAFADFLQSQSLPN
ncbi:MAG: hypothetical protein VKJ46_14300 [Leptolyngbyaceae bacterium]|nr:hypothetical protein [Leptolyngbyaceae bacterium]